MTRPGTHLRAVLVVAALDARGAVRARTVLALAVCSGLLMGLFAFAALKAMAVARAAEGTVTEDLVGATLLGTAAFTCLLLGAVVAVFLAHATVRGDAERGLLQPLVVRPVSRAAVVLGRLLAAAGLSALYTALLWLASVIVMRTLGEWSPPSVVEPGLALAAAAALVALTAVAASTALSAMAAGVATLVVLGLGFLAGLVAQLGTTLGIPVLGQVADAASLALPYEALYRHVLAALAGDVGGVSVLGLAVGPFGGASALSGAGLAVIAGWALALAALALLRARRLDL